ncbi:hypothetical protein [Agrobacterium rosae]|uniref:hypothetical protein n=1 Tax=Agrobacterium rosae TaxID=1972867 RepID=UPI003B9FC972
MFTITPMTPVSDPANKQPSLSNGKLIALLAAAWVCAAISLCGLTYGTLQKAQEYRASVTRAACL